MHPVVIDLTESATGTLKLLPISLGTAPCNGTATSQGDSRATSSNSNGERKEHSVQTGTATLNNKKEQPGWNNLKHRLQD
jgi:hypothetical protein